MKNKQIFIINLHSFVDVITNSSSELFVIENSDSNSIKSVKEILEFMLKHWNEMALKGIFGDYYKKNNRYSFNGESKDLPPIKTFDDTFGSISIYTEKDYKEDKFGYEYVKEENIGKIIVTSAGDNSIPSEIMDWMEQAFGGYSTTQRFHLG